MPGSMRAARIFQAGLAAAVCAAPVVLPGVARASTAQPGSPASGHCSAGARTLAPAGSHLYPDTGNGGYLSRHTSVYLVYRASTNRFLAGNHVLLTDLATQCLSSFSLDFERTSANKSAGPNLKLGSVTVDGQPATVRFAQPAYPGDPAGPDDPNPAAHEASQTNPVGGPQHNPLPPACSPELPSTSVTANSLNGTQCPANKLVITPGKSIHRGSRFTVSV